MKKILWKFVLPILCLSMLVVVPKTVKADAHTVSIKQSVRNQRLANLKKMATDGCHFNTDNVSRYYNADGTWSEEVVSVYSTTWFKNYVGIVPSNIDYMPAQYTMNSYSRRGYCCFGFATFALWYLNAENASTDVWCYSPTNGAMAFNYANVSKYVDAGDVLRLANVTEGLGNHSVIVLGYDSNGITVLDANSDCYNTIKVHTYSYSAYSYCRVTKPNVDIEDDSKVSVCDLLKYASDHYNDGVGTGVQFASACLQAAGTGIANNSINKLHTQLVNSSYGTAYDVAVGNDGSIKMSSYMDKMSAGDIVFYYCESECADEGTPYVKVVICNGMDANGYMKAYAHPENDGTKKITYATCGWCSGKIKKASVFHFNNDDSCHKWDSGVVVKTATCNENGIKTYKCTTCKSEKYETIAKNANNHAGGTVVKNEKTATCKAEGYTGDTHCKGCNAKLKSGSSIAKKNHSWDKGEVVQASTRYVCTVCGTTKNVPLYPDYTIKFNGNGSTSGSMASIGKCVAGEYYELPAVKFKRTGYTFVCWSTKKDGSGNRYDNKELVSNLSINKQTTITLYAQWKANKYTVKFNGNGSTSGKMNALSNKKYGASFNLTANAFKKKGYTFNGWNTKADGSGKAYKNKASVKNLTGKSNGTVTLYAQWKKTKYTITYKLNNGKNNKKNPASYYVTTKTFKFEKPTRNGYSFVGWYSDSKCKNKVTQIKKGTTGNKTLYAKWKKK